MHLKRSRLFISFLAIFVGIILMLSCGQQKIDNVLKVVLSGNPDTLDPQKTSATITSQVNSSIYESLFRTDGSPALAKSWSLSDDGLVWTLELVKDRYFHHGKELTAKDVIATLERLYDLENESPFVELYRIIQSTEEIASHTVRIVLRLPYAGFSALLASPESAILPADLIASGHNFSQKPVGTGPFAFKRWEQNHAIELKRNTRYPQDIALEGIAFVIIKDLSAQMLGIFKGEIDIVPYVGQPERLQIEKNTGSPAVRLEKKQGSTILLLAMNTRKKSLASIETRKSIAQAIDKKKILEVAYDGGKELNVFWHSGNTIFRDVPFFYDPKKSARYFQENPISETLVITVPDIYAPHARAAEMYQEQLRSVGLNTKIEKVDWTTWLNRVYRGADFDLTVIGHTGKLDPYQRFSQFGAGASYVGWRNQEYTRLLAEAQKATESKKRDELYGDALELITADSPFVFVGENEVQFAVNERVSSFEFDKVLERYDFRATVLENQ